MSFVGSVSKTGVTLVNVKLLLVAVSLSLVSLKVTGIVAFASSGVWASLYWLPPSETT